MRAAEAERDSPSVQAKRSPCEFESNRAPVGGSHGGEGAGMCRMRSETASVRVRLWNEHGKRARARAFTHWGSCLYLYVYLGSARSAAALSVDLFANMTAGDRR